jgi:DNA-directed RNA polymerase specialized sigma24 family protein
MLSIPSGTVRSRLHRAMAQLRERLQPPNLAGATHPELEGSS